MGTQNLAGFRTMVQKGIGDKQEAANEILDNWINSGYLEALGMVRSEGAKEVGTAATIIDEWIYGLPSDCFAIRSILYRNANPELDEDRSLLFMDWEEFQRLDRTEKDIPTRYTRRGNSLYVWPVPPRSDDIIEIQYIQEDCVLSAAADVTILPARFDRLIHLLAIKAAFIDLGLFEQSGFLDQLATSYVARVGTEEKERAGARQVGIDMAYSFDDLTKITKHGD